MIDDAHNFKLAGINKKNKGSDKHSDLIKNHINILEAVIPAIKKVSKYGTERQIKNEINKRIRECQNILGMWGDRRSGILYFEKSINFLEVKDKNKFTVEHVIPVSATVQRYIDGDPIPIEKLIFNPIALITTESDKQLREKGLAKSGHDFDFPFRRYKQVEIEIKDLHGTVINCENFSIEDHFELIHKVPELQEVINEINDTKSIHTIQKTL